jgi:hypothetical protein
LSNELLAEAAGAARDEPDLFLGWGGHRDGHGRLGEMVRIEEG